MKCRHIFAISCRITYRDHFFASEHSTDNAAAAAAEQRACLPLTAYNTTTPPSSSSSSSGQPRARVAGLHARRVPAILLWLVGLSEPEISSRNPATTHHHPFLSDTVRDHVIVQHVGVVAHSSTIPATDINTSSVESMLTPS